MTHEFERLAPPSREPGRPFSNPEFQYSVVIPDLFWIGEAPRDQDLAILVRLGVTEVVNLTSLPEVVAKERRAGLTVHHFPFPDGGFVGDPTCARRVASSELMSLAAARVSSLVMSGRRTYLHCVAGISRSPTVLILWLIDEGRARSFEEALELVWTIRPVASPNPELVRILREIRPLAFR